MEWHTDPGKSGGEIFKDGPYLAAVWPHDFRGWFWQVNCQPAGELGRLVERGEANQLDEARQQAEDAVIRNKRPGRVSKGASTMTSTERSKVRAARMAARAIEADVLSDGLNRLHSNLMANGSFDVADELMILRRVAALKAAAEYARRNRSFFVTRIPALLDPENRRATEGRIVALADDLDKLAEAVPHGQVVYEKFEAIRKELQRSGFWIENSLVSAVARSFFASPGVA